MDTILSIFGYFFPTIRKSTQLECLFIQANILMQLSALGSFIKMYTRLAFAHNYIQCVFACTNICTHVYSLYCEAPCKTL